MQNKSMHPTFGGGVLQKSVAKAILSSETKKAGHAETPKKKPNNGCSKDATAPSAAHPTWAAVIPEELFHLWQGSPLFFDCVSHAWQCEETKEPTVL